MVIHPSVFFGLWVYMIIHTLLSLYVGDTVQKLVNYLIFGNIVMIIMYVVRGMIHI